MTQFSTQEALQSWLLKDILLKTVTAILLGLFTAKVMNMAEQSDNTEKESFLSYTIALSLLAFSAAEILSLNGIQRYSSQDWLSIL